MTKKIKTDNKENQISLDELLIDFGKGKDEKPQKYKKLFIAMKWAYHLKNTEEYKDKPATEIIEKALIDIFSGRVDQKTVDAACEKDEEMRLEKLAEKKKTKLLDE